MWLSPSQQDTVAQAGSCGSGVCGIPRDHVGPPTHLATCKRRFSQASVVSKATCAIGVISAVCTLTYTCVCHVRVARPPSALSPPGTTVDTLYPPTREKG